jgi:hypothetical protein
MNDEICKIELSSESIDFRSTVIKSFLTESFVEVESTVDVQSINDVESENVQSSDDENQNLASEISIRLIRTRRLSLKYQNFANITVFLQNDEEISLFFILTFIDSRRKEINDVLKWQIFEIIIYFRSAQECSNFQFSFCWRDKTFRHFVSVWKV